MLRTAWTDEWERADGPGPLPMPIQPMLVAEAQRRIHRVADKHGTGANELVTSFVGLFAGSMASVQPTRRVVRVTVEIGRTTWRSRSCKDGQILGVRGSRKKK